MDVVRFILNKLTPTLFGARTLLDQHLSSNLAILSSLSAPFLSSNHLQGYLTTLRKCSVSLVTVKVLHVYNICQFQMVFTLLISQNYRNRTRQLN